MYFNYLEKADPDITAAMKREINRQETKIEMIASENFVNYEIMEAMGSALTNKYAEGYPGKRYYGGCEFVDEVEQMAIDRAKKIFGAEHANVQAHSGANANTAVYQAVLEGRYSAGHGSVQRRSSDPWIPGQHFRKVLSLCSIRTGSGDGNHRLRQRKRTGTQAPAKADRCRCVRLSERDPL